MRHRGFCAITGSAAVLVLSACSFANHPAELAAPTAASAASTAGQASATAVGAPASPRAAKAAASVTITAVGDTMLGSAPDIPPDPATYIQPVESILGRGAQIVFGNLEGTLTTSATSKCGAASSPHPNCFAFRDPPSFAADFKRPASPS
jgi:hypothetical protein